MDQLLMGAMGVGALSLLVALLWWSGRGKRRRRDRLRAVAGALGWRFTTDDSLGLRKSKFLHCGWHRGRVGSLMQGQVDGSDVRLFDYTFGAREHRETLTFAMFRVAHGFPPAAVAEHTRFGPARDESVELKRCRSASIAAAVEDLDVPRPALVRPV